MKPKEQVINEFKELLEENKRNVQMIVAVAEELNLTNEQYYLDWEDFLNMISVKEH